MPKVVDPEERREHIARVSAQTIAEIGLEQTTMREIAQRAGVSKGVVEHYFTNKEEVIDSALAWMNARYIRRETRHLARHQGLAALRARLYCALPLTPESVHEWKIRLRFWSLATVSETARDAQRRRLNLTRNRFVTDLEQARQMREIPQRINCADIADTLMHFVAGLACNALLDPDHYHKIYLRSAVDKAVAQLAKGVTP
ncbi:MAG: TetR family transcriptional regulator [Proteobacteria bacterium]|nr:TetR family transcriptional regulator [Pseudomonadota bacterium]HQR05162.1 TetR family transcriptional regulator [Rhodocyclaceae bacterium]